MRPFRESLPSVMRELHRLEFDYAHGSGIDFEPYQDFQSADETRDWIRAWTGNPSLDGKDFQVFGQDGTGGLAAFWSVQTGADLLAQPIVFLGPEGELGVVARNFGDYLWLLAGGFGPYEAVAYPDSKRSAQAEFTAFAEKHAPESRAAPSVILSRARRAFPEFEATIRALCR